MKQIENPLADNISWIIIEFKLNYAEASESKPSMVCKIKKALYDLNKAPRAWYVRLDKFLLCSRFKKGSEHNNNFYL